MASSAAAASACMAISSVGLIEVTSAQKAADQNFDTDPCLCTKLAFPHILDLLQAQGMVTVGQIASLEASRCVRTCRDAPAGADVMICSTG
jgi:hypothetical protein